MGDAAYLDNWDGRLHKGRNPNSRVHPEGVTGIRGGRQRGTTSVSKLTGR